MFELIEKTKAKMVEVAVLSQKNRKPEDKPGAKLTIELALPNYALIHFDQQLRGMLFRKASGGDAQSLPGIESVSDLPSLSNIGAKIGSFSWEQDFTGYEFTIVYGTGRKESNIVLEDCVLSGWHITPKEGGTAVVKVNIESQNVSESQFGKLAHLKSRDIDMLLTPPDENAQPGLDDDEKDPEPERSGGRRKT